MISRERRTKLKKSLAVMIDLTWRSGDYNTNEEEDEITVEEEEYLRGLLDTIIARLQ